MAKKKKSKSNKNKEKVCETFEIKKKEDKKEPEIKTVCGMMEKKHATSEEIKNQNKLLRNILIALGLIFLIIIGFIIFSGKSYEFEHRGVAGRIVQEGNLIFYENHFERNYNGQIIPWYIYLRNDPRKLDKIGFEGELDLGVKFVEGNYALSAFVEEGLSYCPDSAIAFMNMKNLHGIGVVFFQEEGLSCDEEGRYMHIDVVLGEKTEIIQKGNACYDVFVKSCDDLLKATERFMFEIFVKHNQNK